VSKKSPQRITVIIGKQLRGCYYESLLSQIENDARLELDLIMCGERTSPELDTRCCVMVSRGFRIRRRVELPRDSDKSNGMVTLPTHHRVAFSEALHLEPTDLVLLLGEPEEMLPAAQAARTAQLPVAYLHDQAFTPGSAGYDTHRELTEVCHIHFTTTEQDRRTLVASGESPQRVTNCGSPMLDELRSCPPLRHDELTRRLGVASASLASRPLVVTFHPEIDGEIEPPEQIQNLLEAVEAVGLPTVFAYPEGLPIGSEVALAIGEYCQQRDDAYLASRCDWPTYWNLMRSAAALVSTNSIGTIEAGWLRLPMVSIGQRLEDCPQVGGTIHTGRGREEIFASIATVTAKEFPDMVSDDANPYGEGSAASAMVAQLKSLALDRQLLQKPSRPAVAIAMTTATEPFMAIPQTTNR